MSNLKVVVFNAPPRAGKDCAADYLISKVGDSHKRQFKDTLIDLTSKMLFIDTESFMFGYNNKSNLCETGWFKDYPYYKVGDRILSKREALIHMSENIIKPVFGNSAFGDALVRSLPEEGVVFIPDSGFIEELLPVIEHVGVENVLLVRIHRKGCTFEGDSRDYLDYGHFTIDTEPTIVDIMNNNSLECFHEEVLDVYNLWRKADE